MISEIRAVCIHHTASPTETDWIARGGWSYWKPVLERYYRSKGWVAMPHVFAAPDGRHILWPLDRDGRGVGGGALERGVRHVEIVGNYNDHLPSGATLRAAIEATVAILRMGNLTPDALTHHTAVVGPGVTECPGAMLKANWSWFIDLVADEWRRTVNDAPLEKATALRFELEEIQRMFESANLHEVKAETELTMAENERKEAHDRLKALISTRNGLAYYVEKLLGGNVPPNWEG